MGGYLFSLDKNMPFYAFSAANYFYGVVLIILALCGLITNEHAIDHS
jgi:hypothetical protein